MALPDIHECWFLTGATASGKTEIGLQLAEQIGAEIISLDSMAIYRQMNIGTAKASVEDQGRVPHHLIDIVDPTDEFSLSQYVDAAERVVREIRSRGRQILFVGGTPLYLKSLLHGIFQGPPADWDFREQVQQEADRVGAAELHRRLTQVDPLSAAKLHPNDTRRIIRALEVYKLTGSPISHQQMQFDQGRDAADCRVFVLTWPRPKLRARIDQRVQKMFSDGLIDEVRDLLKTFTSLGRTARQAVGYREVIELLTVGQTLEQTIQAVQTRTHQFAKRQETWFRSLSECRRVTRSADVSSAEAAAQIHDSGAVIDEGA